MKDNAGFAVILIVSIGLNIVLGIIASDCPDREDLRRQTENVEIELQTLRRRLDRSMRALRDANIPINDVFGIP
jgi:hypothetical protein